MKNTALIRIGLLLTMQIIGLLSIIPMSILLTYWTVYLLSLLPLPIKCIVMICILLTLRELLNSIEVDLLKENNTN